jgi:hypothetical protein
MFHDLTGLYCPLCGSQRAVAALLHGDFSASLRNNMLFVLALPLFIYSFVIACFSALATNYTKQKIFYSSTSYENCTSYCSSFRNFEKYTCLSIQLVSTALISY